MRFDRPVQYLKARLRQRGSAFFFALCYCCGMAHAAQTQGHDFDDPFLIVTTALARCPPPKPADSERSDMHAEAHYRAERGNSCYQSGRCRLPNSYLYDKEIIPRVKQALLADGRFDETSIAIEGQRRWVWLMGCVRTAEQAQAAEQLVRGIDDVEAVINALVVLGP